jgi:hypothetical protein
MTKYSGLLLAISAIVGALPAAAQETALPSADAPAPRFLWSASDGATGPAPDCDLTIRSGPDACPRDVQKRWRRHQAELQQLDEVIAEEGPAFSESKYRRYVGRIVVGAVLMAAGVVGVVYGIAYGAVLVFSGGGDDESDPYKYNDLGPKGTGLGTLLGGIAAVGIGVPLLISGARGKNRQKILRRANEIRAPFDPFEVSVSFAFDPRRGAGGLTLRAEF